MTLQKLPAFTLLELVVVIAIAAALMGIGINSLRTLRDRTSVKLAVDEFVLAFNGTRNLARNSVLSNRAAGSGLDIDIQNAQKASNLDYYAMIFQDEQKYYRAECTQDLTKINCTDISGNLKTEVNSLVNVRASSSNADYCKVILFNLSTGKFQLMNLNFQTSKATECTYTFTHQQDPAANITVSVSTVTGKAEIKS
jgi:type II secretory pathway pseudopilin PulG